MLHDIERQGNANMNEALDRRNNVDRYIYIIYLLVIGAFSLLYLYHNNGSFLEDSYMTYRYALNFRDGYGLVFNQGERYFGTTAAGYAVLLALTSWMVNVLNQFPGAKLPIEIPAIGTLYSAISLFTIGALLPMVAGLMPSLSKWLLCALASAFLFSSTAFNAVSGHETYVFIALAFAATVLISYFQRYGLAAAFLAAAAAVRPDTVLFFFIILALDCLRTNTSLLQYIYRRQTVVFISTYVILMIAWEYFIWNQYGTLIPGTLAAKRIHATFNYWPIYSPLVLAKYFIRQMPIIAIAIVMFGLLVFAIVRFRQFNFASSSIKMLDFSKLPNDMFVADVWLLFAIVSACVYSLMHVTFWIWYGVPILFSALLVSFVGWTRVPSELSRLATSVLPTLGNRPATSAYFGTCLMLAAFIIGVAPSIVYWARTNYVDGHAAAYSEIVDYLHQASPEGATVLASEPGSLGYHLGPKYLIVDELGLVSPGVAQALQRDDYLWSFKKWRPKYLICSWLGKFSGCYQDRLKQYYELVGTFNKTYWNGLEVYDKSVKVADGAELYRLKDAGKLENSN